MKLYEAAAAARISSNVDATADGAEGRSHDIDSDTESDGDGAGKDKGKGSSSGKGRSLHRKDSHGASDVVTGAVSAKISAAGDDPDCHGHGDGDEGDDEAHGAARAGRIPRRAQSFLDAIDFAHNLAHVDSVQAVNDLDLGGGGLDHDTSNSNLNALNSPSNIEDLAINGDGAIALDTAPGTASAAAVGGAAGMRDAGAGAAALSVRVGSASSAGDSAPRSPSAAPPATPRTPGSTRSARAGSGAGFAGKDAAGNTTQPDAAAAPALQHKPSVAAAAARERAASINVASVIGFGGRARLLRQQTANNNDDDDDEEASAGHASNRPAAGAAAFPSSGAGTGADSADGGAGARERHSRHDGLDHSAGVGAGHGRHRASHSHTVGKHGVTGAGRKGSASRRGPRGDICGCVSLETQDDVLFALSSVVLVPLVMLLLVLVLLPAYAMRFFIPETHYAIRIQEVVRGMLQPVRAPKHRVNIAHLLVCAVPAVLVLVGYPIAAVYGILHDPTAVSWVRAQTSIGVYVVVIALVMAAACITAMRYTRKHGPAALRRQRRNAGAISTVSGAASGTGDALTAGAGSGGATGAGPGVGALTITIAPATTGAGGSNSSAVGGVAGPGRAALSPALSGVGLSGGGSLVSGSRLRGPAAPRAGLNRTLALEEQEAYAAAVLAAKAARNGGTAPGTRAGSSSSLPPGSAAAAAAAAALSRGAGGGAVHDESPRHGALLPQQPQLSLMAAFALVPPAAASASAANSPAVSASSMAGAATGANGGRQPSYTDALVTGGSAAALPAAARVKLADQLGPNASYNPVAGATAGGGAVGLRSRADIEAAAASAALGFSGDGVAHLRQQHFALPYPAGTGTASAFAAATGAGAGASAPQSSFLAAPAPAHAPGAGAGPIPQSRSLSYSTAPHGGGGGIGAGPGVQGRLDFAIPTYGQSYRATTYDIAVENLAFAAAVPGAGNSAAANAISADAVSVAGGAVNGPGGSGAGAGGLGPKRRSYGSSASAGSAAGSAAAGVGAGSNSGAASRQPTPPYLGHHHQHAASTSAADANAANSAAAAAAIASAAPQSVYTDPIAAAAAAAVAAGSSRGAGSAGAGPVAVAVGAGAVSAVPGAGRETSYSALPMLPLGVVGTGKDVDTLAAAARAAGVPLALPGSSASAHPGAAGGGGEGRDEALFAATAWRWGWRCCYSTRQLRVADARFEAAAQGLEIPEKQDVRDVDEHGNLVRPSRCSAWPGSATGPGAWVVLCLCYELLLWATATFSFYSDDSNRTHGTLRGSLPPTWARALHNAVFLTYAPDGDSYGVTRDAVGNVDSLTNAPVMAWVSLGLVALLLATLALQLLLDVRAWLVLRHRRQRPILAQQYLFMSLTGSLLFGHGHLRVDIVSPLVRRVAGFICDTLPMLVLWHLLHPISCTWLGANVQFSAVCWPAGSEAYRALSVVMLASAVYFLIITTLLHPNIALAGALLRIEVQIARRKALLRSYLQALTGDSLSDGASSPDAALSSNGRAVSAAGGKLVSAAAAPLSSEAAFSLWVETSRRLWHLNAPQISGLTTHHKYAMMVSAVRGLCVAGYVALLRGNAHGGAAWILVFSLALCILTLVWVLSPRLLTRRKHDGAAQSDANFVAPGGPGSSTAVSGPGRRRSAPSQQQQRPAILTYAQLQQQQQQQQMQPQQTQRRGPAKRAGDVEMAPLPRAPAPNVSATATARTPGSAQRPYFPLSPSTGATSISLASPKPIPAPGSAVHAGPDAALPLSARGQGLPPRAPARTPAGATTTANAFAPTATAGSGTGGRLSPCTGPLPAPPTPAAPSSPAVAGGGLMYYPSAGSALNLNLSVPPSVPAHSSAPHQALLSPQRSQTVSQEFMPSSEPVVDAVKIITFTLGSWSALTVLAFANQGAHQEGTDDSYAEINQWNAMFFTGFGVIVVILIAYTVFVLTLLHKERTRKAQHKRALLAAALYSGDDERGGFVSTADAIARLDNAAARLGYAPATAAVTAVPVAPAGTIAASSAGAASPAPATSPGSPPDATPALPSTDPACVAATGASPAEAGGVPAGVTGKSNMLDDLANELKDLGRVVDLHMAEFSAMHQKRRQEQHGSSRKSRLRSRDRGAVRDLMQRHNTISIAPFTAGGHGDGDLIADADADAETYGDAAATAAVTLGDGVDAATGSTATAKGLRVSGGGSGLVPSASAPSFHRALTLSSVSLLPPRATGADSAVPGAAAGAGRSAFFAASSGTPGANATLSASGAPPLGLALSVNAGIGAGGAEGVLSPLSPLSPRRRVDAAEVAGVHQSNVRSMVVRGLLPLHAEHSDLPHVDLSGVAAASPATAAGEAGAGAGAGPLALARKQSVYRTAGGSNAVAHAIPEGDDEDAEDHSDHAAVSADGTSGGKTSGDAGSGAASAFASASASAAALASPFAVASAVASGTEDNDGDGDPGSSSSGSDSENDSGDDWYDEDDAAVDAAALQSARELGLAGLFATHEHHGVEALLQSTHVGRVALARADALYVARVERAQAAEEERVVRLAEAKKTTVDAVIAMAVTEPERFTKEVAELPCCPWCARYSGVQRRQGIDVDLAFNPHEMKLY